MLFTNETADMTRYEFFEAYNTVRQNLLWADAKHRADLAKQLQKEYKFAFLTENELKEKIQILKNFDINLLWDKTFMGVNPSCSICAVASEPYYFLRKLKDNF